ncbi:MAG: hypothetical protein RIC03_12550 [Cyclobacteriaceae bacterium]
MISVVDFKSELDQLKAEIPEINHLILVTSDTHAVNKLNGKKGICFVAVIPSFDGSGRLGRVVDDASTYFFIVEKEPGGITEEKELELMRRTQQVIEQIKNKLIGKAEDGCSLFYRLTPEAIHIDPEYKTFGGYSGWSMSLVF